MHGLFAVLLLLYATASSAGEVTASGVQRDGDRFHLFVTAQIRAPGEQVFRAITDYQHLPEINPSFETSEILLHGVESDRVRTRVRVCILVFCKRVVQVQDVRYPQPGVIEAEMVPGAGDFHSGSARWVLLDEHGGTRLEFTEQFEPAFWVPPVIGSWLIRRKLVEEMEITMHFIEQSAGVQ